MLPKKSRRAVDIDNIYSYRYENKDIYYVKFSEQIELVDK